ncbi:MAG TPA: holo-ACP synthase [Ignavibacteriaceae bacterium]|nr:holo-ACP synthase [Ignavibacteriaceae bacterium]
MVLGIGVDIIEIARIKQSIERTGDRFLKRVFTEKEIEYCVSKGNKYQHFAARFAAKEAISKALSIGWNNQFDWKNVEVLNEKTGEPKVHLNGLLKDFLPAQTNLKITMSHSDEYAVCFAILEQIG